MSPADLAVSWVEEWDAVSGEDPAVALDEDQDEARAAVVVAVSAGEMSE
jgi:hypothetical protein